MRILRSIALSLTFAGAITAAELPATAALGKIEVYSANHPDTRSRGYTVVRFENDATAHGCSNFWMAPNEKEMLATLLSAKATGMKVELHIETTAFPPWAGSSTLSCRINQVTLN